MPLYSCVDLLPYSISFVFFRLGYHGAFKRSHVSFLWTATSSIEKKKTNEREWKRERNEHKEYDGEKEPRTGREGMTNGFVSAHHSCATLYQGNIPSKVCWLVLIFRWKGGWLCFPAREFQGCRPCYPKVLLSVKSVGQVVGLFGFIDMRSWRWWRGCNERYSLIYF